MVDREEFNSIFMEFLSRLDNTGKLQLCAAKEHIWQKLMGSQR